MKNPVVFSFIVLSFQSWKMIKESSDCTQTLCGGFALLVNQISLFRVKIEKQTHYRIQNDIRDFFKISFSVFKTKWNNCMTSNSQSNSHLQSSYLHDMTECCGFLVHFLVGNCSLGQKNNKKELWHKVNPLLSLFVSVG